MNLNKYFSLLTLAVLVSCGLNAQVFWTEDFSGGDIPMGWTNVDLTSNAGEEVVFVWTDDPDAVAVAALGNTPTAVFNAPGADNGYLWANSDRGLPAAPATEHTTELTTTAIDCSAATEVYFTAQALIGVFELNADANAILRVSTDLATWDEYTLFPNLTTSERWSENPQGVAADITASAAGESTIYLQIRWVGGWEYFWAIDDMELTTQDPTPPNEMQVNTFAAVAPNAQTPASQVEPINFIADIENVGADEQTNVTLNISITNGNGDEVYTEDLDYGTIASDSLAENVFFPGSYTPAAMEDIYTGTYSLSYDNEEGEFSPENNELDFVFAVTDSVFAKELGATRSVAPAADESYTYGNVFYIANGQSSAGADLTARYISFGVANPEELAGRTVTTFLYEWPGDTNQDFAANQDEYSLVGFNIYTFTGEEDDAQLITVPVSEDGFIPLTEGAYYIAAVQYQTDDDVSFFLQASEEYDYAAMNFITDSLSISSGQPLTRYAAALDVSNEGDLGMLGFGLDIVPVVRLSVDGSVNVDEVLLPETAVNLFPNPVNDIAKIDFKLEEAAAGTIEVFNINAQRVAFRELDSILNERVELNTKDWPAGNYMIRIRTDLGVRTLKMVVQH